MFSFLLSRWPPDAVRTDTPKTIRASRELGDLVVGEQEEHQMPQDRHSWRPCSPVEARGPGEEGSLGDQRLERLVVPER